MALSLATAYLALSERDLPFFFSLRYHIVRRRTVIPHAFPYTFRDFFIVFVMALSVLLFLGSSPILFLLECYVAPRMILLSLHSLASLLCVFEAMTRIECSS